MPHLDDPVSDASWALAEGSGTLTDALGAISDELGGAALATFSLDPALRTAQVHAAAGIDPALLDRIAGEFDTPDANPTLRYLPNSRPGRLMHRGPWMDWDDLVRTAFYQRFWRPSGVGRDGAGMRLPVAGFGDLHVYLGRRAGTGWLGAGEERTAEMRLRTLGRALTLRLRAAGAAFLAEAALGRGAVFLLGEGRQILSRAGAAEEVTARGTIFRGREGRAEWAGRRMAQRLQPAFEVAMRGGGARVPLAPEGRLTMVDFAPGPGAPRQRTVIMTVTVPEAIGWDAAALRDAFDLTPREAAVTIDLIEGHPPACIAARLRLKPGSVRIYLKQVYRKTGAAGQVALLARLAGHAPVDGGLNGGTPDR